MTVGVYITRCYKLYIAIWNAGVDAFYGVIHVGYSLPNESSVKSGRIHSETLTAIDR